MYILVKGCPRLHPQVISNLLSDRIVLAVDDDTKEDEKYEGRRVAIISDEICESNKEGGET